LRCFVAYQPFDGGSLRVSGGGNVDGVEETPLVKGRLGDMQIARLSLCGQQETFFALRWSSRGTDGVFVALKSLAPSLTRRTEFRIRAKSSADYSD
jgi:hypothetical protein